MIICDLCKGKIKERFDLNNNTYISDPFKIFFDVEVEGIKEVCEKCHTKILSYHTKLLELFFKKKGEILKEKGKLLFERMNK